MTYFFIQYFFSNENNNGNSLDSSLVLQLYLICYLDYFLLHRKICGALSRFFTNHQYREHV